MAENACRVRSDPIHGGDQNWKWRSAPNRCRSARFCSDSLFCQRVNRDEQQRGKSVVVAWSLGALAVPVIGPELCGILSPPFGTTVILVNDGIKAGK